MSEFQPFSEWIEQKRSNIDKAGEAYEELLESSKLVIDDAIERYIGARFLKNKEQYWLISHETSGKKQFAMVNQHPFEWLKMNLKATGVLPYINMAMPITKEQYEQGWK